MQMRFLLKIASSLMIVVCIAVLYQKEAEGKDVRNIHFELNKQGFITTWLLCGPFPNPGIYPSAGSAPFSPPDSGCEGHLWDYLKEQGGEEKIEPIEGLLVAGGLSPKQKWELYYGDENIIDFDNIFKPNDEVVSYAFCYIDSKKVKDILLKVGSDDTIKIWFNHELVHDFHAYRRGVKIDEEVIKVKLKKGLNSCLVKIGETIKGWGFCMRLTDLSGEPIKEVKIVLPFSIDPATEGIKVKEVGKGKYLLSSKDWAGVIDLEAKTVKVPEGFQGKVKIKVALPDFKDYKDYKERIIKKEASIFNLLKGVFPGRLSETPEGIILKLTIRDNHNKPLFEYHRLVKPYYLLDYSIMENYKFPEHLIRKVGKPAFKYRFGQNTFMPTFHLEGCCIGKGGYFATLLDIPELYGNDPELKKKILTEIRANQKRLLESINKIKKENKEAYIIPNINLIHIPKWGRENLLNVYPEADSYCEECAWYPWSICPAHPVAERIVKSMIKECFQTFPSDGLMVTIGDNGGTVRCCNPDHNHNNDAFIKEYFFKTVKWVYSAMKEINPNGVLFVRPWSEGRCLTKMSRDEIDSYLPQEDIYICTKHASPPSYDYCWNFGRDYSPFFKRRDNIICICGWKDFQGGYPTTMSIYCDWPEDTIYRDMKYFKDSGVVKGIWGTGGTKSPDEELSCLAFESSEWNPDFNLEKLKEDWAKYRFGKGWEHVLNGMSYGPKILKKITLYHKGLWQMDSLHIVNWTGQFTYGDVRGAPSWLEHPDRKALDAIFSRLDATPEALNMLSELEKALNLVGKENKMLNYLIKKASWTLTLTKAFRDYHWAYLNWRVAIEMSRETNERYGTCEEQRVRVNECKKLLKRAKQEVEEYCRGCNTPKGMRIHGGAFKQTIKDAEKILSCFKL